MARLSVGVALSRVNRIWWALTICSQANNSKGKETLNQADRIDPAQHDGCIDVTIADLKTRRYCVKETLCLDRVSDCRLNSRAVMEKRIRSTSASPGVHWVIYWGKQNQNFRASIKLRKF